MSVVLRLSRHGTKKKPFYRVVAADKRFCRDGRHLEILGTFDPKNDKTPLKLDLDRVQSWVKNGAQPSDTVSQLIRRASV